MNPYRDPMADNNINLAQYHRQLTHQSLLEKAKDISRDTINSIFETIVKYIESEAKKGMCIVYLYHRDHYFYDLTDNKEIKIVDIPKSIDMGMMDDLIMSYLQLCGFRPEVENDSIVGVTW